MVSEGQSRGWSTELTAFADEVTGPAYFVDQASRSHALGQIECHSVAPRAVVLDVGCSSGRTLSFLGARLPGIRLLGADYVHEPLRQIASALPATPLLQLDLTCCPLREGSIDVVLLLNVLEHIADDTTAVGEIFRTLKPGGVAIIEVPAGPHLYDDYDRFLQHRRRYRLRDVLDLVRGAGFQTSDASHLGFGVYPGFWLMKRRNQRARSRGHAARAVVADNVKLTRRSRIVDALLAFVTGAELFFGRWIAYPVGIRCLVTCVKPAASPACAGHVDTRHRGER
jgi:SAM-dependent methyltransferase